MMSEEQFQQIKLSKNNIKEIAIANKASVYSDVIPFHLNIGYPIVNYSNFIVHPNEFMMYATPASVFKEKERVVGYTGGSHGASVRLFKGFWIHSAARKGTAIRKNIREFTKGDLIVTNQRIVFLAYKDAFELKVEKVSSCRPIAKDALVFQSGNIIKTVYIERIEVLKYVYACANAAISASLKGYDLYEENENFKRAMTKEKEIEYEKAKRKVARVSIGNMGCFLVIKKIIAFLGELISIIFLICLCAMVLALLTTDKLHKEKNVKKSDVAYNTIAVDSQPRGHNSSSENHEDVIFRPVNNTQEAKKTGNVAVYDNTYSGNNGF